MLHCLVQFDLGEIRKSQALLANKSGYVGMYGHCLNEFIYMYLIIAGQHVVY